MNDPTRQNIRNAARHLVLCWDALREAEKSLRTDITVDQLSDLAAILDTADDADRYLTEEVIDRWWNAIDRDPRPRCGYCGAPCLPDHCESCGKNPRNAFRR